MKKKLFSLLLAVVASAGTMSATITVRLCPPSSWSTIYLWAWTNNNTDLFDEWPGKEIVKDSSGWYSYTFNDDIDLINIIWSDGNDNKTGDIENVSVSTCYLLNSKTGYCISVKDVDCSSNPIVYDIIEYIKIDTLYYDLNDEIRTAEVAWNYSASGDIIIPSFVTYNSKTYSVTSIGGSAFNGCSSLTSVTIPSSITSIGSYAFRNCSSLTSVEIPNSVESIGSSAFSGCSSLTSVTIPSSITSIGSYAFSGCSSLTSVHISDIAAWCAIKFSWDANPLSYAHNLYLNGELVTDLVIPNSVTNIGSYAFEGCDNLTSITIPNSVTNIGSYAFYGCRSLTSIYVPCGELERFRHMLGYDGYGYDYRVIVKYEPLPYNLTIIDAENGSVTYPKTNCDDMLLTATPDYGYHFTQWSDGVKDNPRTIVLTQDTTFTALFAHNPVITYVYNAQMGSVSGPTMTATGIAAENITFNATPNYGYHFVQWNDGNIDNPRTIWLSQDTTFTALFAVDKSGTCGDNLALKWAYDSSVKSLTISGEGTLNSNYTFGVEAPNNLESLVIAEGVTSIGNRAFASQATLKDIYIPSTVTTVGEQAFYNCTGLRHIYNYRERPAVAYSNSFDGIDKFGCTLHVYLTSVDMYKAATAWRDFYYIDFIQAAETDVTEVQTTAFDNSVIVEWPAVAEAEIYTLKIECNGVTFCVLSFNAQGQLLGIQFAPGRDGSHNATYATQTATGWQFTVTSLEAGTTYDYTVTAKKEGSETPVYEQSGSFTTTSVTAIDQVTNDQSQTANKIIKDGQIFILRVEKVYTVTGQEVK